MLDFVSSFSPNLIVCPVFLPNLNNKFVHTSWDGADCRGCHAGLIFREIIPERDVQIFYRSGSFNFTESEVDIHELFTEFSYFRRRHTCFLGPPVESLIDAFASDSAHELRSYANGR